jgi:hypothetical protein
MDTRIAAIRENLRNEEKEIRKDLPKLQGRVRKIKAMARHTRNLRRALGFVERMMCDDGKYKFYFIVHEESAAIVRAIAQNRIVDGICERIQHNIDAVAPTPFKINLSSGGETDTWHVERTKGIKILGGRNRRIECGKYEIAGNDSHTKAKIDVTGLLVRIKGQTSQS